MFSKALSLATWLLPRGLFVATAAAAWLDKTLHVVYFTLMAGIAFMMEIAENTARIPKPTEKEST